MNCDNKLARLSQRCQ